ncbi:hypothetical protein E3Q23_00625 [Wallemia mellicola]|uniref:DH domain-containing protein n=1 Tax=Wallemia mellicola TaxID=1708541 RepID=A0A4V4MUN1_9BASI|nr:hypothetical protein E3Q23_00625 [Wallemia mellicola]TIB93920.1 hypothetical protein E3Q19_00778 [Wallemia mellicola]TIC13563.1 hypothetical protein E3Q15_01958 [Wallemia mellicola]TIC14248.1 hypothetical protein E3Q14_00939 [Wallemia mellicola]TIC30603.1 hypothetical protein E3Q11_00904 [Wallemia mellicola]
MVWDSTPSSSTRPLPPSNVYSRIYIPSNYKNKNRISSCSTRSFESLPEGEQASFKPQQYSFPVAQKQKRHSGGKYTSYKKERAEKRWRAILELLETERLYVKDLELIWTHFVQPLKQSGDDALLTQLFPHFQHILNTNKELLRSLECAVLPGLPPIPAQTTTDTNPTTVTTFNSMKTSTTIAEALHPASPSGSSLLSSNNNHRDHYLKTRANIQLAPTLLNLLPFLKLYTPFIRNFENSQRQINSLLRTKPEFSSFIRNAQYTIVKTAQGGSEWNRLGINSKLLAVVQRVPRYKLLLSQILKYTDETSEEFENLQRALKLVSDVADTFETHIAQYQHTLSLLTLQKNIFGLPFPIVAPGRTHVKSGWLVKIGRKKEEVKAFFLLNDCLIYASPTSSSVGSVMGDLVNVVNPVSPPSTPSITEFKNSPFSHTQSLRPSTRQNSSHRLSSLVFPVSTPTGVSDNLQASSAPSGRRGHKHSSSMPVNIIPPPSLSASISSEEETASNIHSRLVGPIDIATLNQCFTFNRKLDLEDVTVVAIDNDYPQLHGRTFQIISSQKSFNVYAESEEERNAWLDAIRSTKDDYLSAFRTLKIDDNQFPLDPDSYIRRRGNSTNTTMNSLKSPSLSFSTPFSGASTPTNRSTDTNTSHRLRRRSVHAYAEVPTSHASRTRSRERTKSAFTGDISAAAAATAIVNGLRWNKQEVVREEQPMSPRSTTSETKLRVLEHYAAPVWVPDSKTLNFLIVNDAGEHQLSRACDDCYDTAFPTSSGGEDTEEEIVDDNATTHGKTGKITPSTRSTSSTSLNGIMLHQSTTIESTGREPSLTRSSYATSSSSIASACPTSAPSSPPTTAVNGSNILYSPPKPQSPTLQANVLAPSYDHRHPFDGMLKNANGTSALNSGFNPSAHSVVTCTSTSTNKTNESFARLGVGRRNLAAPRITTPKAQQSYRNFARQPATPQTETNVEVNKTPQPAAQDDFEERLKRAAATIAPSRNDEPLTDHDRKKIEGLRRLVEKRRSVSHDKSVSSPASKTGTFRRAETVMSPTKEKTPKSTNNPENKTFRKEVIVIEDTESEDVDENHSQDEVEGEVEFDRENTKSIGANEKETIHDVGGSELEWVLERNRREEMSDDDYEPDEDSQDEDAQAKHKRGHAHSTNLAPRRSSNRRKYTSQSSSLPNGHQPSHNTPRKTRKSTLRSSPSPTDPPSASNTVRQPHTITRNTGLTTTKSSSSLSAPSRKAAGLSKSSTSATQEELEEFDKHTFKFSIRLPDSGDFDSLN